jgi:hypothetical protein
MFKGRPVIDEDRANVNYQFADAADLARFQSDVRVMELLGTFDAETVRAHGDEGWGVASGQRVQLWRSREPDGAASLSFFASRRGHHCEFPLGWFQKVTADDKNAAVKLAFVRNPGVADVDDSQTVVWRLLRRLSSGSSGSHVGSNGAVAGTSPSESSGSVAATSSSSIGGSSGGSSGRGWPSPTHAQKMARRARGFRHLRIEFAVPKAGERDAGEWKPCELVGWTDGRRLQSVRGFAADAHEGESTVGQLERCRVADGRAVACIDVLRLITTSWAAHLNVFDTALGPRLEKLLYEK